MNIKTLDSYFSQYIRLRDANDEGYCQCCTCLKWYKWNNMDAGHFISRMFKSTRWNEKNCNPQCKSCNRFQSGKQYEHGLWINQKYGKDTAEIILIASKKTSHLTGFELKALGDHFRNEVKRLKKEKGL